MAQQWLHLEAILHAELRGLGLWINSARLTPTQTVDRMLADPPASLVLPVTGDASDQHAGTTARREPSAA